METVDFMSFPAVPTVATSQINRAGRILRKPTDYSGDEFVDAFYLTLQWRACHALPLNTFQSTLRTKLKKNNYKGAIAAQRLKRYSTIVHKLQREPSMALANMQDIAGVR